MEAPFGFLQVETMFFSTINDCAQGNFLAVGFVQTVLKIAIIIGF